MKTKQKGIGIRIETKNDLLELKEEGQSYDGVIRKLITVYREQVFGLKITRKRPG